MADRTKLIADAVLDGVQYGVFYYPKDSTIYSAKRVQRLAAVFESPIMDGGADLLSWKSLAWDSTIPSQTRVYVHARAAATEAGLSSTGWSDPYLNGSQDISGIQGRYLQVSIVLYSDGDAVTETMPSPAVSGLRISSYVTSSSSKFYTKTFSLGFKPRSILLTYNGTVPEGAMVRFAVAGEETTDMSDFQIINPNKVEELKDLSDLSEGLKVMILATGSTEVPFVVDEFSVAISGDGQVVLQ